MLVQVRDKQDVSGGGGATMQAVSRGEGQIGCEYRGRGKQKVSGEGGVNRVLVEGER